MNFLIFVTAVTHAAQVRLTSSPMRGRSGVALRACPWCGRRKPRGASSVQILVLETLRAAIVPVSGAIFFGVPLCANAAFAAPVCASDEAMSKELESCCKRCRSLGASRATVSCSRCLRARTAFPGPCAYPPDGVSCIAATGRYWQTVAEKKLAGGVVPPPTPRFGPYTLRQGTIFAVASLRPRSRNRKGAHHDHDLRFQMGSRLRPRPSARSARALVLALQFGETSPCA